MQTTSTSTDGPPPSTELSGRWVVIVMFSFAIIVTGGMWTYWYFDSLPFRPLQVAIGREFEKSVPRVQGGQRKMHKKEMPRILRITLRVYHDPLNPDQQSQTVKVVDRLYELTIEHLDVSSYDVFEVNLYWRTAKGDPARQFALEIPFEDLTKAESHLDLVVSVVRQTHIDRSSAFHDSSNATRKPNREPQKSK